MTGVRIDTVAHFGRHTDAKRRTALELGSASEVEALLNEQRPYADRRLGPGLT